MGVWNPRTNAGTVHFADYAELPAKKIWSWGSMLTAWIGGKHCLTMRAGM